MDLVQEQYKLQEDSIQILKDKLLQSSKIKKVQEVAFAKKYFQPMAQEIHIMREENLPNVLGNIFEDEKYAQDIFHLIQQHKDIFSSFSALEKNLQKGSITPYLLEDIAKFIAIELLQILNSDTLYYKENLFYKELLNIITETLQDMDATIQKYALRQKQSFALITLLLNDMEIAFSGFVSISKLLIQQKTDEDDKVKPNSEHNIIKGMAETLFYNVSQKTKKNYLILMQELSNEHLLEFGCELFIRFESFDILEQEENFEKGKKLDLYKLSDKFIKDSKTVYENIFQYTPPFFEPMVVEPLQWKSINDGGYLKGDDVSPKFTLYIQKTKTKKDRKKLEAHQEKFSKKLLKSVNIIQSTKWKINSKMLQTLNVLQEEYIQTKEQLKEQKKATKVKRKNYQKRIDELMEKIEDISAKYSGKKEAMKEFVKDKTEQEKRIKQYIQEQKKETKKLWEQIFALSKQKKALTDELQEKVDKLDIQNTLLTLANKYEKYDTIYFTWQIDFRGRIYPVQALLNPQGESMAKSLLEFATKKKLDKNGVKWLQIHGANTYGVDKVSFEKRLEWIQQNTTDIQRVANLSNPLNDEWLLKADKPFEFLAFCYEYDAYLQDPHNFESSLPVAVDGSNNGFQHIAALLRDTEGAKKVNVLPNDTDEPADIYKEVAIVTKQLLETALQKDNKLQDFQEEIKILLVHIDRSFVKKGVMTDSYGAGTKTKAEQLHEKLETLPIEQTKIKPLSLEVAKYLDKAIDTIAPSSALYKKWINTIGTSISKLPQEIVWHTPFINFEVRQYKYKTITKRIVSTFEGKKNTIQIHEETDEIDAKEQARGIAPNFIHSLDATHMYMTILSCHQKGLNSFATVHDSFATHASDVETLVETLKEEFIKLTEYDVLQHFQKEMKEKYGENIVKKDVIQLYVDTKFDIHSINFSPYFFA